MRSMSVFELEVSLVAHRRQVQAFVENFTRLPRTAAGHRTADIAFVRDRTAETEQRAVDEDRRNDRHVGRMRTAALIRMIDQERVTLGDRAAEFLQHRGAAGRKSADMQWQHDVLRDDLGLRVHQGAGGILRLAHDR